MQDKFKALLEFTASTIYPEPESDFPAWFVREQAWPWLQKIAPDVKPPARILDVGCGNGFALDLFHQQGFIAAGVTLNASECLGTEERGLFVYLLDMHHLDLPGPKVDLVWARHVLEHSPCPLLVLRECFAVLKPGGWLYAEMPAPDTAAAHQTNPNHFAVLPRSAWYELITRAGFQVIGECSATFGIPAGTDEYFMFAARRP